MIGGNEAAGSDLGSQMTPSRPKATARWPWDVIGKASLVVAVASLTALAATVRITNADALAALALTLASIAFVVQIIVFVIQSSTAHEQELRSEVTAARLSALVDELAGSTRATRNLVENQGTTVIESFMDTYKRLLVGRLEDAGVDQPQEVVETVAAEAQRETGLAGPTVDQPRTTVQSSWVAPRIQQTDEDSAFLAFMAEEPSEEERNIARQQIPGISAPALIDLHQLTTAERTNIRFGKPPGLKTRRSAARDELRALGLLEVVRADPQRFATTGIRTEDLLRDVLTDRGRRLARVFEDDLRRARRDQEPDDAPVLGMNRD